MDVQVVKDGVPVEVGDVVEEPTEALRPKSAMLAIKEARQKIIDGLYIDLRVPRYPEGIDAYVRYGPVKSAKVDQAMKRRSAQEHDEYNASLLLHVDILVDSCLGIYYVLDGNMDNKYSFAIPEDGGEAQPTEHWTRFDKDLARTLEMTDYEMRLAENVCRKFYFTDGDIIDASSRLSTWSAQANDEAKKDFI
jgi:hypothetical protein